MPYLEYSLDTLWEESSKGKAFRHVSSRALLFLLVEAEIRPGDCTAAQHQPEERVRDHAYHSQHQGKQHKETRKML